MQEEIIAMGALILPFVNVLHSWRFFVQHRLLRHDARELVNLEDSAGHSPDFEADGAHSEFGDLDAQYFRSCNVEALNNPREVMSKHRVTLMITRLMRPYDQGPLVSEGHTAYGLPEHVAPTVPADFNRALSDLATLVIDQLRPRYIHRYLDEIPPYQWDNQTDPERGSFGIVRKATCQVTGNVVAIKTFAPYFSSKDRLQISREIGVIEVCRHPNLIQLLDAYETPDKKVHLVLTPWAPFTLHMFLACDQQALARSCPWFLPGQQASMDIILGILYDLADGVHYLHLKFIKHKDIKPENILLYLEGSRDVRPILADFGTSKVYKSGRPTKYTDSTYSYLAPEQNKKTGSSLKSDVWQLGCCFAMTLTRACGGDTAVVELEDTYADHSGNIAMDLAQFLSKFRRLCASMPEVLKLTCGMLEEDPAMRWTIAKVRSELAKVVSKRLGQN